MSKIRNPQQKKKLSYEHDRRNTYGESSKGSRKSIPLRKKAVLKSYRRNTKQQLAVGVVLADPSLAEEADSKIATIKKKTWRKVPDAPLRDVVRRKIQRRVTDHGRRGKRLKALSIF